MDTKIYLEHPEYIFLNLEEKIAKCQEDIQSTLNQAIQQNIKKISECNNLSNDLKDIQTKTKDYTFDDKLSLFIDNTPFHYLLNDKVNDDNLKTELSSNILNSWSKNMYLPISEIIKIYISDTNRFITTVKNIMTACNVSNSELADKIIKRATSNIEKYKQQYEKAKEAEENELREFDLKMKKYHSEQIEEEKYRQRGLFIIAVIMLVAIPIFDMYILN